MVMALGAGCFGYEMRHRQTDERDNGGQSPVSHASVQERLGDKGVRTTRLYAHVLNKGKPIWVTQMRQSLSQQSCRGASSCQRQRL